MHISFSVNGPFTDMQITYAVSTNTVPYKDKPWLLNFLNYASNNLDGPFLLWPEEHLETSITNGFLYA